MIEGVADTEISEDCFEIRLNITVYSIPLTTVISTATLIMISGVTVPHILRSALYETSLTSFHTADMYLAPFYRVGPMYYPFIGWALCTVTILNHPQQQQPEQLRDAQAHWLVVPHSN